MASVRSGTVLPTAGDNTEFTVYGNARPARTSNDRWPRHFRQLPRHDVIRGACDSPVLFPSTWQSMKRETVVAALVNLESKEGTKVKDLFYNWPISNNSDIAPYVMTITRIFRIQNPPLWAHYYRERERMARKNGGDARELMLFHGTSTGSVDSICRKGYEVERAGSAHAQYMGRGIYFAADSRWSHVYTTCGSSEHCPHILTSSLPTAVRVDTWEFEDTDCSCEWHHAHPLTTSSEFTASEGNDFRLVSCEGQSGRSVEEQRSRNSMERAKVVQLAGGPQQTDRAWPVSIPVDKEADPSSCRHYVFACSVLVGCTAPGNRDNVMPPLVDKRNPQSRRCDSCYGRHNYYLEFVVYRSDQAYPEYLIEYSHQESYMIRNLVTKPEPETPKNCCIT